MGIASALFPEENTSSGRFIGFGTAFDAVADPEDDGEDVIAFADFMRATKAPPRGPITAAVTAGESIFTTIGSAICHTATIVTARSGSMANAGKFVVPDALGDKIVHPYIDYLLHDVGSGDGIPFLPTAEFASIATLIRTAQLWALRTGNRLMHNGLSFTKQEAIQRHLGQAAAVTISYNALADADKVRLLAFLDSL